MLLPLLVAQVGLGIERTGPVPATAPVSCTSAADPAIETLAQERVESGGGVDRYVIHVSIINRGARPQDPADKQYVAMYQNDAPVSKIGVPPLESGEAYAFSMRFKRSSDAGNGSTSLVFRFGFTNYRVGSDQDCNARNDQARLTF